MTLAVTELEQVNYSGLHAGQVEIVAVVEDKPGAYSEDKPGQVG